MKNRTTFKSLSSLANKKSVRFIIQDCIGLCLYLEKGYYFHEQHIDTIKASTVKELKEKFAKVQYVELSNEIPDGFVPFQPVKKTPVTRTYQSEFGKDFNLGINLEGWEDNSWKNDVCPNFTMTRKVAGLPEIEYRIWVDFENQKDREIEDGKRYVMEYHFEDSDNWVSQWEVDEPEIAEKLISTLQAESNSISVFRTL